MIVLAKTRVPPARLQTAFRREIQAIDSDIMPMYAQTLDQFLALNYRNNGMFGVLFVMFAAMALLLASVGLYAVLAHAVSQRTQEIGIRIAIGATARDIVTLVFAQGLLPAGIGVTIGLAASFAVNRVLKSALVQVSPTDPTTLVVACIVPIVSATLARTIHE